MAKTGEIRIRLPRRIKKGDIVEVKVKLFHPMESGLRKNKDTGELYPKQFIKSVEVYYGAARVCWFETGAGMSKNPLIVFKLRVEQEDVIKVVSTEDQGKIYEATAAVKFSTGF